MMRQPGLGAVVTMQSLLGEAGKNRQRVAYDATDTDRIGVLASSRRNGLPTSAELKQMLVSVRNHRAELLSLASDPRTNLRSCITSLIDNELTSLHRIQHNKKKENVRTIVALFPMMTILRDRALGEQPATRQRKLSPVQSIIVSLNSLNENVDEAIDKMVNDAEGDSLLKGLPLSPQAKSLRFDVTCIPKDPAHQRCPFCGLDSLNLCPENQGMQERNELKLDRYSAKMEVWNRYQQMRQAAENAGDPPPPNPSHNGDVMNRKPRQPGAKDLESPMVQCMNSTARCVREGSDIGSLCFMRCRVKDDDDARHPADRAEDDLPRYPWEMSSRTHRKRCSCPYCKSQCNKRFKIADFQAIALRLIARSKLAKNSKTGEEITAGFINTVMANAMSSTSTALKGSKRGKEGASTVDARDVFATNAGSAAVRLSHSLPSNAVESMQQGMGRDTTVTLPCGQRFDTRLIGDPVGKHGKNNRLPGQDSAVLESAAPGMLDRLQPKYDNVTEEFASAAKQGPSASVQLLQTFVHQTNTLIDLTTEARGSGDEVAVVSVKPPPKPPPCPQTKASATKTKLQQDWDWIQNRKSGGDQVFDKIFYKNMARMHAKKSKRSMTDKEKRERRVAKRTAKYIEEAKPKSDEVGREVAAGFGITSSQVTAFVEGKVRDCDGDLVNDDQLLRGFRRMRASQDSDDETED